MNSSVINVLEIFKAAASLNSVGFSAGYGFDESSAEDYFKEFIQNEHSKTPIFSGIIVIEATDANGDFVVVDGLQRITTLHLLLAALCKSAKNTTKKNEDSIGKIFKRYLTTRGEVKLHLAGEEGEIFKKIILSKDLTEGEEKSELFKVYSLFLSKISEGKVSFSTLFDIVAKIQFLVVFADKSQFELREVYQSLNNKKGNLTQIRLIESFISQHCPDSLEIWNQMKEAYEECSLGGILKYFIRDFLAIQNNGRTPTETSLYISFKYHFYQMSKYQSGAQILSNLKKFSAYYLKIMYSDFEDEEIKKTLISINENNGQDSYPYLMEVLDDFENSAIRKDMFLEILNVINEFMNTRENNLREGLEGTPKIDFTTLSTELNKMIMVKSLQEDNKTEGKLTINDITHLSTFGV